MTSLGVEVSVNLKSLKQFKDTVDGDLARQEDGPVRKALKRWALRYRAFLRERYIQNSRGGGDWPPLKPSTIRARRGTTASILIDKGTMFGAFSPVFAGLPGQLEQGIPYGIRVGVGGAAPHPDAGVSVAELIRIHHLGLGVVPTREIVVPPDARTAGEMREDMRQALEEIK